MTLDKAMAEVLGHIASTAGEGDGIHAAVKAVAKELDAMSRTKYKPRPPWFSLVCEQVARALREGLEVKT